ncbi:chromosome segregation protein ScpA [Candidatus Poribacteria bacterium]|nr:chromosome segregation protein ScpA [Candidatus Poribacteria bacterium]
MYEVKLNVFQGPLDLLLYLIKKNEVDIYDIPIAQIAEQYVEYISLMKMLDLDIASEFLVMAATLLHMKSEAMLPAGSTDDNNEEMMTREELVRQLIEYRKFKDAASVLAEWEKKQNKLFPRLYMEENYEELDLKEFKVNATLFDLLSAFRTILQAMPDDRFRELREETVTVQQKMDEILSKLKDEGRVEFSSFFSMMYSRIEIVVCFLAILELIRTKDIIARQSQIFGQIWLYKR